MKNTTLTTSLAVLAAFAIVPSTVHADSYASSVISSSNMKPAPFDDPAAALGAPTTYVNDTFGDFYHASLVNPAYGIDGNTNANLLAGIGTGGNPGSLVVKFDTAITHSDSHWYGQDFIVYGNSFFVGGSGDFVDDSTDLRTFALQNDGSIFGSLPTIEVSADGTNFVTVTASTPLYPDNPYRYNPTTGQLDFNAQEDFTKPVDPTLTNADFGGLNAAQAIDLYDGSAGGSAFSLAGTGLTSIQYIRASGFGVVDAISAVSFSNVSAVPEPGTVGIFVAGMSLLAVLIVRRKRIA